MKSGIKTAVILPDIRSTHNVGSIFRTCDAAGISKIYLTGYTPTPADKFGRPRKDIAKASLGAESSVAWEYAKDTGRLIDRLKKEGFIAIAIEQSASSVDYKKAKLRKGDKAVFIFGNEVDGLPEKILKKCDIVAEIPMSGMKESLNISVSAGIALFRILGL